MCSRIARLDEQRHDESDTSSPDKRSQRCDTAVVLGDDVDIVVHDPRCDAIHVRALINTVVDGGQYLLAHSQVVHSLHIRTRDVSRHHGSSVQADRLVGIGVRCLGAEDAALGLFSS